MYVHKRNHLGDRPSDSTHLKYDTYRIKQYHQFNRNETIKHMIKRAHKILEENDGSLYGKEK